MKKAIKKARTMKCGLKSTLQRMEETKANVNWAGRTHDPSHPYSFRLKNFTNLSK
jgi:hypothetical protein